MNIIFDNNHDFYRLSNYQLEVDRKGIDLAIELKDKSGCEVVLVTPGEQGVAGIDCDGTWIENPPRI